MSLVQTAAGLVYVADSIAVDPTVSPGYSSPVGSFVVSQLTGATYFKNKTSDTGWTQVSTTAAPVGGNSAAADWFGQMQNIFAAKTGLNPLQWSASIRNDFTNNTGLLQAGTGATSTILDNPVSGTGVANFLGPSSGNGLAYWLEGGSARSQLPNMRQKRWMIASRVAVGTVPNSHTTVVVGAFSGTFVGIGFAGAAPGTWHYVRGSQLDSNTTTQANVDLGVTLDTSGSVYVTAYVANFDLTNVVANANVGIASDIIVEAAANMTNGAGYTILQLAAVGGGGGADIVRADKLILCSEL